MTDDTGSNEFSLRNRRSKNIIRLTRSAVDSYSEDGIKSIADFKTALDEAWRLQVEENIRNKTILICQFNLYVANICVGAATKQSIELMENIIPDAEKYEPSIIPDILYYIGRGHLTGEDTALALDAFKKAEEERCAKNLSDWPLHESNNDLILHLETDDREKMRILRENIEVKARKGPKIEDICEMMEMTYTYFDILLKENAQEAKKEAKNLIRFADFADATELEKDKHLLERKKKDKDIYKRKITSSMWCDIGLIYTQLQRYTEARQCFGKARDIDEDTTEDLQISHNIAAVWVLENEFNGAVEEYENTSKGTIKSIKNKDLLLHVYLNWAFCYLRQEQTDKAYNVYTEAFNEALALGDMDSVRKALEGLIATILTLEKSVETVERYKLELGLLDCDDIGKEKAETVKKYIDERRDNFKSHESKKTTQDRNTGEKPTDRVDDDIGKHAKSDKSSKENGKESTTVAAEVCAEQQSVGENAGDGDECRSTQSITKSLKKYESTEKTKEKIMT